MNLLRCNERAFFCGIRETGTSEVSGKRLCRAWAISICTSMLILRFSYRMILLLGVFVSRLFLLRVHVANGESSAMRSGCSHKSWTTRNLVSLELVGIPLQSVEDPFRHSSFHLPCLLSSLPPSGGRVATPLTRSCCRKLALPRRVECLRLLIDSICGAESSAKVFAFLLQAQAPARLPCFPVINASWPEEASMVGDAALAPTPPPAAILPLRILSGLGAPARSCYPDARSPISPPVCHLSPLPQRVTRVSEQEKETKRTNADELRNAGCNPLALFLGRAVWSSPAVS